MSDNDVVGNYFYLLEQSLVSINSDEWPLCVTGFPKSQKPCARLQNFLLIHLERINSLADEAKVDRTEHISYVQSDRFDDLKKFKTNLISNFNARIETALKIIRHIQSQNTKDSSRHDRNSLRRIADEAKHIRDNIGMSFDFGMLKPNQFMMKVHEKFLELARRIGSDVTFERPKIVEDKAGWDEAWTLIRANCLKALKIQSNHSPEIEAKKPEVILPAKQLEILAVLKNKAMYGRQIAAALKNCNLQTLTDDYLSPMKRSGLIKNDRKIGGYYDPFHPPQRE